MKLPSTQSGFAISHMFLGLLAVAIVGFAGWRVYEAKKNTDSSLKNAGNASEVVKPDKKQNEPAQPVYKIPDGYKLYENKKHGFKLAQPQNWDISDENVVAEPASSFIYNYRGYDMPTYFDPVRNEWYTKSGSSNSYISPSENDLIKVFQTNGTSYFYFLGKGALYCGNRHILFQHSKTGMMIFMRSPLVCTEDAKSDPDPNWNQKTYFIPQFEKDLEQVLSTIQEI